MTLNQLTILTKVIELQSFSRAAEELYIQEILTDRIYFNFANCGLAVKTA